MPNPPIISQVPRYSPEQMNVFNTSLNKALEGLNKPQMQPYNFGPIRQGLEQNSFAPIAQREVSRFQTQTVPTIAERFTSFGNNSNRGSSAFTGALSQGGVDLGERLAALGSNFGLKQQELSQNLAGLESKYGLDYNAQNTTQLNNLLGTGLTQQNEIGIFPGGPTVGESIAQGGISSIADLIGLGIKAALIKYGLIKG
jgi:hypothetical protein